MSGFSFDIHEVINLPFIRRLHQRAFQILKMQQRRTRLWRSRRSKDSRCFNMGPSSGSSWICRSVKDLGYGEDDGEGKEEMK
jgi:hypothetical protein